MVTLCQSWIKHVLLIGPNSSDLSHCDERGVGVWSSQCRHRSFIYFASAAVAVDSSHMTASSSASWSRFSPPSNFVNGHMSTMWFMVCHWPQTQEGDWAIPHSCKLDGDMREQPLQLSSSWTPAVNTVQPRSSVWMDSILDADKWGNFLLSREANHFRITYWILCTKVISLEWQQKNLSHICIQNRVSTNPAKPISRTHFLKISDDCYVTSHTISKCRWHVISINEHVMMSSDQCSLLCHSTRLLIYDHSDPVYLRTSLCKVY